MTTISSLRRYGVKSFLLEREIEVVRFRRSLQPNDTGRDRLMLQFYGHDIESGGKIGKTEQQLGGRLHTIYADDVATIQ